MELAIVGPYLMGWSSDDEDRLGDPWSKESWDSNNNNYDDDDD